jgi:hypothetical protein
MHLLALTPRRVRDALGPFYAAEGTVSVKVDSLYLREIEAKNQGLYRVNTELMQ